MGKAGGKKEKKEKRFGKSDATCLLQLRFFANKEEKPGIAHKYESISTDL